MWKDFFFKIYIKKWKKGRIRRKQSKKQHCHITQWRRLHNTLCLLYGKRHNTLCLLYGKRHNTLCLLYGNRHNTLCLLYGKRHNTLCLLYGKRHETSTHNISGNVWFDNCFRGKWDSNIIIIIIVVVIIIIIRVTSRLSFSKQMRKSAWNYFWIFRLCSRIVFELTIPTVQTLRRFIIIFENSMGT